MTDNITFVIDTDTVTFSQKEIREDFNLFFPEKPKLNDKTMEEFYGCFRVVPRNNNDFSNRMAQRIYSPGFVLNDFAKLDLILKGLKGSKKDIILYVATEWNKACLLGTPKECMDLDFLENMAKFSQKYPGRLNIGNIFVQNITRICMPMQNLLTELNLRRQLDNGKNEPTDSKKLNEQFDQLSDTERRDFINKVNDVKKGLPIKEINSKIQQFLNIFSVIKDFIDKYRDSSLLKMYIADEYIFEDICRAVRECKNCSEWLQHLNIFQGEEKTRLDRLVIIANEFSTILPTKENFKNIPDTSDAFVVPNVSDTNSASKQIKSNGLITRVFKKIKKLFSSNKNKKNSQQQIPDIQNVESNTPKIAISGHKSDKQNQQMSAKPKTVSQVTNTQDTKQTNKQGVSEQKTDFAKLREYFEKPGQPATEKQEPIINTGAEKSVKEIQQLLNLNGASNAFPIQPKGKQVY